MVRIQAYTIQCIFRTTLANLDNTETALDQTSSVSEQIDSVLEQSVSVLDQNWQYLTILAVFQTSIGIILD